MKYNASRDGYTNLGYFTCKAIFQKCSINKGETTKLDYIAFYN